MLFTTQGNSQDFSLSEIRNLYERAEKEASVCKQLMNVSSSIVDASLLNGYRASATMMMARFENNPFRKYALFRRGKQLLHDSIENNSQSIELRFLRFAAQTNTPAFLNYNDHIESDKLFLTYNLPALKDSTLKIFINSFLIGSDYLTEQEKVTLQVNFLQ